MAQTGDTELALVMWRELNLLQELKVEPTPAEWGFEQLDIAHLPAFASPAWSLRLSPATGALASLRAVQGGEAAALGSDWATEERQLGLPMYSTYNEEDYSMIWDHYAWLSDIPEWFQQVRCREALVLVAAASCKGSVVLAFCRLTAIGSHGRCCSVLCLLSVPLKVSGRVAWLCTGLWEAQLLHGGLNKEGGSHSEARGSVATEKRQSRHALGPIFMVFLTCIVIPHVLDLMKLLSVVAHHPGSQCLIQEEVCAAHHIPCVGSDCCLWRVSR